MKDGTRMKVVRQRGVKMTKEKDLGGRKEKTRPRRGGEVSGSKVVGQSDRSC